MIRFRIVGNDDACDRWDMWREFSRSFSALNVNNFFNWGDFYHGRDIHACFPKTFLDVSEFFTGCVGRGRDVGNSGSDADGGLDGWLCERSHGHC